MKKRYVWIIIILLIVIAFFAFGKKMIFKKEKTEYRTAEVTKGEIRETVTATGSLGAVETVNVGTQVSGTIAKINVDFNSKVKKGQVIALIDPTPLQISVASAEANLQKAKLSAQLAKLQMDPVLTLKKQDLVSQSDVDNARIAYDVALANVKTAEYQLQLAKTNLRNATILAPISGVVISRAVDPGQTVAASFNTPTLFSIANDLRNMQVIASVDEADIGKVKTGQKVTFNVDAFPDREYDGMVTQIRMQPSTDNNVVTYNVVVSVVNEDLSLLPGMTANLTILVTSRENVFKVPVAALQFKPPFTKGNNKGAKSDSSFNGMGQSQNSNNTGSSNSSNGGRQWQGNGQNQGQKQQVAGMGQWPGRHRGMAGRDSIKSAQNQQVMEPGKVYLLVNGQPQKVKVMTGISDGTYTEVKGELKEGDQVIIGVVPNSKSKNGNSSSNSAPGFGGFGPGRGH
ncbi:MAG TPA: efflux RND transporter periplasmic adaptor subunit [Candidatus Cloacimonadota bacterium]|nr:efflux RND transporter periplasmic adaptor subunit [Candidatus Cloacimonadota bacterium]HPT70938.1 efflux RND transporter periplasmic adaptor subunit [Candidatus Cloacimonadota bacterium]